MVRGVHPVGIHAAKVLLMELDEAGAELSLVSKLVGKGVGLELPLAREHVDTEVNQSVHGRQGVVEENETDNDGVLGVETKRLVQRSVVDEDREESEDLEQVELSVLAECD